MLVEIAIGDQYGAGFEYADQAHFSNNDLSRFYPHPLYKTVAYTDDAQMSLAVAEAMLAAETTPTAVEFAESFVGAFKRDQRRGYASRFYDLLKAVRSGEELLATIVPKSERSGAAMRSTPIGAYPDLLTVLDVAAVQAAITHNTMAGIQSAQAAALGAHYTRYRFGALRNIREFIVSHLGAVWQHPHQGEVDETGFSAVNAALTALENCSSLAEALQAAVAFQGDVDTVAAIAMGIGSQAVEIDRALPDALFDGLENGAFGRDYLQTIDQRLDDRFYQVPALKSV